MFEWMINADWKPHIDFFPFVSWSYTLAQYLLTSELYIVDSLCTNITYVVVIGFFCSYHPASTLYV